MKPVIIDLYCGAGGAGEGYHRAGFDVIGVDINPQPRYPFRFLQADVLDFLAQYTWVWSSFKPVAFHASPPCQHWSDLQKQNKRTYPELIEPTRIELLTYGLPYVIENVEGAPLRDPLVLCGTQFPGLRVIRHRQFEMYRFRAPILPHRKHPLVFTHDKRKNHYGKLDQNTSFVQVTGGGNSTVANARDAMGIDWMTKDEINEAIPPAYTEYVGGFLMDAIITRKALAA